MNHDAAWNQESFEVAVRQARKSLSEGGVPVGPARSSGLSALRVDRVYPGWHGRHAVARVRDSFKDDAAMQLHAILKCHRFPFP